MVSKAPGSQDKPPLLEFYVDIVQNRSGSVTWEVLRMLNTNITTPMASEAPVYQANSPLLEFHLDIVQNRSEYVTRGVFEDAIYTIITTPRISEATGTQGRTLSL